MRCVLIITKVFWNSLAVIGLIVVCLLVVSYWSVRPTQPQYKGVVHDCRSFNPRALGEVAYLAVHNEGRPKVAINLHAEDKTTVVSFLTTSVSTHFVLGEVQITIQSAPGSSPKPTQPPYSLAQR